MLRNSYLASLGSMCRFAPRRSKGRHRPLFCLAIFSLCVASALSTDAQTFENLVSFNGKNGAGPSGPLIQGTDGHIYGTTEAGGQYHDAEGDGLVFKITPTGAFTTLVEFCPQDPCVDGKNPGGGVVQGADGNFYGIAGGGADNLGIVFKLTPSGTLTTLYSFPGGAPGRTPGSQLVQGTDGEFYGTTVYGGSTACGSIGCGTIFKITSTGTLTTVHTFAQTDGAHPGQILLASDGNFYGATASGGSLAGGGYPEGTVFQMTPAGILTTLHTFAGYAEGDGSSPNGVTEGTDGNFYGTTGGGGVNRLGTVFRITSAGALTILYSFTADGFGPSGLMEGSDGNFYGTTSFGGLLGCSASSCGTIFQITPTGVLTTLHNFDGADGSSPYSGVMQATNGTFYGTTTQDVYGATCERDFVDCGTLFSLSMGLAPFITPQPALGAVGKKVAILGTNLTGATAVSFNGTPATFTVTSSAIDTTVPSGATSGAITVTTPSGTLSSNVVFTVTQ